MFSKEEIEELPVSCGTTIEILDNSEDFSETDEDKINLKTKETSCISFLNLSKEKVPFSSSIELTAITKTSWLRPFKNVNIPENACFMPKSMIESLIIFIISLVSFGTSINLSFNISFNGFSEKFLSKKPKLTLDILKIHARSLLPKIASENEKIF